MKTLFKLFFKLFAFVFAVFIIGGIVWTILGSPEPSGMLKRSTHEELIQDAGGVVAYLEKDAKRRLVIIDINKGTIIQAEIKSNNPASEYPYEGDINYTFTANVYKYNFPTEGNINLLKETYNKPHKTGGRFTLTRIDLYTAQKYLNELEERTKANGN